MDSVKRRTLRQSGQRGWASGSFERDEHGRLLCRKMQWKVEKLKRSIYVEAYFSNFHLFIVVDMSSLKTSPD